MLGFGLSTNNVILTWWCQTLTSQQNLFLSYPHHHCCYTLFPPSQVALDLETLFFILLLVLATQRWQRKIITFLCLCYEILVDLRSYFLYQKLGGKKYFGNSPQTSPPTPPPPPPTGCIMLYNYLSQCTCQVLLCLVPSCVNLCELFAMWPKPNLFLFTKKWFSLTKAENSLLLQVILTCLIVSLLNEEPC